jgi:hypothetical protein
VTGDTCRKQLFCYIAERYVSPVATERGLFVVASMKITVFWDVVVEADCNITRHSIPEESHLRSGILYMFVHISQKLRHHFWRRQILITNGRWKVPNVAFGSLVLLLRFREVTGSNLCPETDWDFSWFFSILQANARIIPWNRPSPLPSVYFTLLINHPIIQRYRLVVWAADFVVKWTADRTRVLSAMDSLSYKMFLRSRHSILNENNKITSYYNRKSYCIYRLIDIGNVYWKQELEAIKFSACE